MLSDQERATLRQVEILLAEEDPSFVRSFEDLESHESQQPVDRMSLLPGWVYTLGVIVAATLAVLMTLAQLLGFALLCVALTTAIVLLRRKRTKAIRNNE